MTPQSEVSASSEQGSRKKPSENSSQSVEHVAARPVRVTAGPCT